MRVVSICIIAILIISFTGCATAPSPKIKSQKQLDIRLAPAQYQETFRKLQALAHNQHLVKQSKLYVNYTSRAVNAVTWDDYSIVLHIGLINYVKSYDELVAIMGHELCHIANEDLGRGRNVPSKVSETEADVCGMRLAKQLGYSCEKAAAIWLRFAKDNPNFVSNTHPAPMERYHNLLQVCR